MTRKPKKIDLEVSEEQLKDDLERYAAKALELGASNATIVTAHEIPVDERVTLK